MKNLLFIAIIVCLFSCQKKETTFVPPKLEYTPIDTFPKKAFWSPVTNFANKVPNVYISTKGNTIVNEPKVQSIMQIQLGDTNVF